ncbi:MAG: hypothetical protein Q8P20_09615 [bacterium]|nr:hypothetical protein [bacterium]
MPIDLETLKKYADKSSIFIETGTHTGATVKLANAAGFKRIYSIELSDKWHAHNKKQFAECPHIKIIHGNSGAKLAELLTTINQPCVLWLDAHYSGGDTANSLGPIYAELEAIKNHPIKNHTILIDDMRGFGQRVIDAVIAINYEYNITYEDAKRGKMFFKDDILVATI